MTTLGMPPLRDRADIITAHELLSGILDNRFTQPPKTELAGLNLNLNGMVERVDTLCWVLHHDSNGRFREYLEVYARQIYAFTGQRIAWVDDATYTGPFVAR